jgi:hypothetical protein
VMNLAVGLASADGRGKSRFSLGEPCSGRNSLSQEEVAKALKVGQPVGSEA